MSSAEMGTVDEDAKFIGTACLMGYQLQFNLWSDKRGGYVADIVPAQDSQVWGVVYETDDEGVRRLDLKEGVAKGRYERRIVTVTLPHPQQTAVECLTYAVRVKEAANSPSAGYLEVIVTGARERQLPAAYVQQLESIKVFDD